MGWYAIISGEIVQEWVWNKPILKERAAGQSAHHIKGRANFKADQNAYSGRATRYPTPEKLGLR